MLTVPTPSVEYYKTATLGEGHGRPVFTILDVRRVPKYIIALNLIYANRMHLYDCIVL